MEFIDWSIVLAYFVAMLFLAWGVRRRAGQDTESFFAASRMLPWWLAAASLIATSFGADTPMWVTGLVRRHGIQAAWQFWTYFLGVGVAVFVFARYWRRIGVVTDIEMLELRYDGAASRWYRAIYAGYSSLIVVSLILAACIRTTDTLLSGMFDLTPNQRLFGVVLILAVTAAYSAMSGLLGVVITDMMQLVVAFVGTTILAFVVIGHAGGVGEMVVKLRGLTEWPGHTLNFSPQMGEISHTPPGALPIWNAIAFVGFLWWAVTISGGYIAQRLLACKDERHASKAMLTYGIVYWGINAWPWIVVAACSLILIPASELSASQEDAYVRMIRLFSPVGLRGLMFAALLSALMSTVSTMLNWGASYFINDVYKPFIHPSATEKHYVWVSRLVTLMALVAGVLIGMSVQSIVALGYITSMMGAASCVQVLMRWLWGRMNAWGEIAGTSALIASTVAISQMRLLNPVVSRFLPMYDGSGAIVAFHDSFEYFGLRVGIVMTTTIIAIVVASLLTEAPSRGSVERFVLKGRPVKLFWTPMLRRYGLDYECPDRGWTVLFGWVSTTICILSILFGTGKLLFGDPLAGVYWIFVFILSLLAALALINRLPAGQDDIEKNSESKEA